MSSPLENFIRENREEFDADAPDPRVWEKIKEKVNPETKKEIPVRSLAFKRWMAVAASVAVIGFAAILYFPCIRLTRRETRLRKKIQNKSTAPVTYQ